MYLYFFPLPLKITPYAGMVDKGKGKEDSAQSFHVEEGCREQKESLKIMCKCVVTR